jgi:aminopeptidase-like protein
MISSAFLARQMLSLTRDLCRFATGVVADDNAALFDRIHQELPLEIFRFRSGDRYNGWVVPENWRVNRAELWRGDTLVFDGRSHTLGVGRYSRPWSGELDWEELQPHLVSDPALPEAYLFHCLWQYRPWAADWALSMPHRVYATLGPGRYRVALETEYTPGEMLVGHHVKRGRSAKTVVFHSNTCHPHMANDGFAGTAVLIKLFQWLATQDTYYSYRLLVGPEHLGTVFYLRDRPVEDLDQIVSCVFEEMPGTRGAIKVASTFLGGQPIDHAFAHAVRHHSRAFELVPWRKGAGNDETVWEAPGYEVPCVEVTRCEDQFAPYAGYHTSLDTPDLMDVGQMEEMLDVLQQVVAILEGNCVYDRRFDGLICLSNPEYDLYLERPDPAMSKGLADDSERWGHLLDGLLRYFDGETTLLDIAERHGLPFERLRRYLQRFEEKGLVRARRVEIHRAPARRVTRSTP